MTTMMKLTMKVVCHARDYSSCEEFIKEHYKIKHSQRLFSIQRSGEAKDRPWIGIIYPRPGCYIYVTP